MPMYWDAYLADTTHLTTEEHGAYMLLLAAMWWRNGTVPDDDKDNARILGLTPAKWRKIKARFCETISGFHIKDGRISQEKLQKVWKNTQEKIDKARQNGAKGGRPKSNKNNDIEKADGSDPVKRNESIPDPNPYPYSEVTNVTSTPKAVPLAGFDVFWVLWPVKKNKEDARTAWKRLNADQRRAATDAIGAGWFDRWRDGNPDANPIHASTFLRKKRWEDEATAPRAPPAQQNTQKIEQQRAVGAAAQRIANGQFGRTQGHPDGAGELLPADGRSGNSGNRTGVMASGFEGPLSHGNHGSLGVVSINGRTLSGGGVG